MKQVWEALQEQDSALVCDFDGTLTSSGSSMHGIVRLLGSEHAFTRVRDSLYQRYGKVLLMDGSGPEMEQLAARWWREQLELYVRYEIREETLLQVSRMLPERREAVELLENCQNEGIPVWIVSAGIANVIEAWMDVQGLSMEGIHILANRICWEKGKACGYSGVVTARNKAELFFGAAGACLEKKLVFLGDRPEDVCWREEHAESFLLDKCTGVVKKYKKEK